MNTKLSASLKTLVKYLIWTGIAAISTAAIDKIGDVNIPVIVVPLVAALLKAIATFAATQVGTTAGTQK
jgi:hypothetical protein